MAMITQQDISNRLTQEVAEDPLKELRRINPAYMAMYDAVKPHERVVVLRAFDINTPYEEKVVQLAIDKIEQIRLVNTAESKVRIEMAELAARGIEIDNPQMEAEWEEKIQAARVKDKKRLDAEKAKRKEALNAEIDEIPKIKVAAGEIEDALSSLKGLGDKSIEKLKSAGILKASEFMALSHEQRQALVGPLVAEKFK